MSIGPMLPGAIAKISTQSAGGWKIALDIPESAGDVVKQLIGTENKIVYTVSFEKIGDIEGKPRLKPGPKPKSQDPTED